jgi:hypothetical protein
MQQIRETIRLFAGQEEVRPFHFTALSVRVNLQRLPHSNAKAGNTNIILLFISSLYFRESAGAIR